MTVSTQSGDLEDNALLETIRDLSNIMNAKFAPTGIVWTGTLGRPLDLPSDQCTFIRRGSKRGRVVLPANMKTRLSTQEWTPLIASSLAFFFLPQTRRIWRFSRILRILYFTGVAWSLGIILIVGTIFGNIDLLPFLIPVGILVQVALFFLVRYWDMNVIRSLRLEADRLAAKIVGTEQFIHTLEKIDSMRIEDLEENKARKKTIWTRKGVYSWPNLNERLKNLALLRSVNTSQNQGPR